MRQTGNRPAGWERRTIQLSRCARCGREHSASFVQVAKPRVDEDGTEYPWRAWCGMTRGWIWATEDAVPTD